MPRHFHLSYFETQVELSHRVTCATVGKEDAQSEMHIVEWGDLCIRGEGGCGHIWSLEGAGSSGFPQDFNQWRSV
jgi:hypothetical protein